MNDTGEKNFLYTINEMNQRKAENESFQKEKFEKIKPDHTKYIWLSGVVVVVLIALFFLLNQKVSVQDMAGWTVTEAETWASNNGVQLIEKTMYSDDVDSDSIISQDAETGTQLSKNSVINVVVSSGPDPDALVSLPSFDSSWTKTSILTWIKNNHLSDYKFTTQTDTTEDPDLFVSYSIDVDSSEFKRSDAITFVVTTDSSTSTDTTTTTSTSSTTSTSASTGSYTRTAVSESSSSSSSGSGNSTGMSGTSGSGSTTAKSVNVPDFSMMPQSQVTAWAQENNVSLTVSTQYSDMVQQGRFISQSRRSGSTISEGQSITVVYSAGNQVALESFVGRSYLDMQDWVNAQNALGAHLQLSVSYQASSKVSAGCVVSQSVSNAKVSLNQQIEVIVSNGALIEVPDFSTYNTSDPMQTYKAVVAACEQANINARISLAAAPDSSEVGHMLSQSVSAGTIQYSTEIIDIVIGQ